MGKQTPFRLAMLASPSKSSGAPKVSELRLSAPHWHPEKAAKEEGRARRGERELMR